MKRWLNYTLYTLVVAAVGGALYFGIGQPIKVLPLLDPIPPFELVDHRGEPYRSLERGEKPILYMVGATRDTVGLTKTLERLTELRERLADQGWEEKIEFVIMTIDPEHDDPERLASAAKELEFFGYSNSHFLTGSWLALKMAAGTGMGIYFEDPAADSDDGALSFVYDTTWVLSDPGGTVRGRYHGDSVNLETIVQDLELLFRELDADGADEYLYRAAHLFMCYPAR